MGIEEAFNMPSELFPLFLPYSNPRSFLAISGVGMGEATPTFSISDVQSSFLWAPPFYPRVDGTLIKVTYPQVLGTQRGRFALKKKSHRSKDLPNTEKVLSNAHVNEGNVETCANYLGRLSERELSPTCSAYRGVVLSAP